MNAQEALGLRVYASGTVWFPKHCQEQPSKHHQIQAPSKNKQNLYNFIPFTLICEKHHIM